MVRVPNEEVSKEGMPTEEENLKIYGVKRYGMERKSAERTGSECQGVQYSCTKF